ncbi:MAG: 50S ribosomal protein L23 [Syntrophorhabdaceae bacterium]|nr:50S ribosomal protein L23 [Syntrophorhabdaceae bacterium]MDD4197355.1 50S ribosomal protein L23 [Syntrophorhabdaceae bacterium]HOC46014.1 50S ribosomal protein L23 [Syntrophorhabdaceae bacterium]
MNEYDIILRPIITEKSTLVKETGNQYVFEVLRSANKIEIRKAVERLFKVKVIDVHVQNMEGKKKRLGRYAGKRPDWKKAIVKLSPKDKITIFEGA